MATVAKTFMVIAILSSGFVVGYESPDDCDWSSADDGPEGNVALFCHLSAINSESENTNFSVIPSEGLTKLFVKCHKPTLGQLDRDSFASLIQLQELNIDSCRLDDLRPFAFRGLKNLKALRLSTQKPTTLTVREDSFEGLTELTFLNLGQNRILSLPKGELCKLKKLSHLILHQNEVQSIEDLGMGNCLKNLRVLDLSENEISSIRTSDLNSNFPTLESVDLSNNLIRFVLPDTVKLNETKCSLITVNLSNNQISSFSSTTFQKCKSLLKLSLANNSLAAVEEETFDGLRSLEVLDLSGNLLQSNQLRNRLFRDLDSLSELSLSRNQIESVEDLFAPIVSSLKILKLAHNSLTKISSNVFKSMTQLKELDISYNNILEIEPNAFQELSSLIHLLASQNKMIQLDGNIFQRNSHLLVLDLSKNRFQSAPSSLKHLKLLQTLDLSENMLDSVESAAFLNLQQLWRIQLHGNRIRNVTENQFRQLHALQILDLSSNKISHIERRSFDSNQHLQALRLDNNHLTNLDELFNKLSNLKWLNISSNLLTEFDYSNIPAQLHWLDISHNMIRSLGNRFGSASILQLTELDLSFNQVEQLGPHNLPDTIETLLANDNKVSHVAPYTFFKKSNLVKVDLSVNNLKTVDKNSFRLSFENLKKVEFYVTGNPLDCDCQMVWLKSVNLPGNTFKYPLVKDIESIYCKLIYTSEETFVPLVEALNEDFLCPYVTHCFSLCQCCDFDACDCEMTCPDDCTCYHDTMWSRNIAVCSNAELSDLPRKLPMDATEIFLDGNDLPELNSHMFIGRKNLQVLHLNNSHIHSIQNKTFNGLVSLKKLFLQDNFITSLMGGREFEELVNLKELHLENNLIENINSLSFQFLNSLEVLHLQGNRISQFQVWKFDLNPSLINLKLDENPWSCQCEFLNKFSSWLEAQSKVMPEKGTLECIGDDQASHSVTSALLSCKDISGEEPNEKNGHLTRVQEFGINQTYLPLMAVTLSILAVILLITFIAFVYREALKVWIHSKYGVRVFDPMQKIERQLKDVKIFDIFITYNIKDDNFVTQVLTEKLERPELRYQTCLYHRDFNISSSCLDERLVRAMAASRRSILVLSKFFIEAEWSSIEYRSAFHRAIRSTKANKLIVLVMEDISEEKIDTDLRLYLKTSLVIYRKDKFFWQKLRYALPDVPLAKSPTKESLLNQIMASSSSVESSYSSAYSLTAIMSTNMDPYSLQQQSLRVSPLSYSSDLSMSPTSSSFSGNNNNHNGSQIIAGAFQSTSGQMYNKAHRTEHSIHI